MDILWAGRWVIFGMIIDIVWWLKFVYKHVCNFLITVCKGRWDFSLSACWAFGWDWSKKVDQRVSSKRPTYKGCKISLWKKPVCQKVSENPQLRLTKSCHLWSIIILTPPPCRFKMLMRHTVHDVGCGILYSRVEKTRYANDPQSPH